MPDQTAEIDGKRANHIFFCRCERNEVPRTSIGTGYQCRQAIKTPILRQQNFLNPRLWRNFFGHLIVLRPAVFGILGRLRIFVHCTEIMQIQALGVVGGGKTLRA